MSDHHEKYLKNLRETKWIVVKDWPGNKNCGHPAMENSTCGKYENSIRLIPANGDSVPVPQGYFQRSGLWICPKHISLYELTN